MCPQILLRGRTEVWAPQAVPQPLLSKVNQKSAKGNVWLSLSPVLILLHWASATKEAGRHFSVTWNAQLCMSTGSTLALWALFFCPSRRCVPWKGARKPSAEGLRVVCHHLSSHQRHLRARTFFLAHSYTWRRASDGPGKAMSVVEEQLWRQLDERGGCHTVPSSRWRSRFFEVVGFPLLLEGGGLELFGEAGRGPRGSVGGVHRALPVGAEAPTSNPVDRR